MGGKDKSRNFYVEISSSEIRASELCQPKIDLEQRRAESDQTGSSSEQSQETTGSHCKGAEAD